MAVAALMEKESMVLLMGIATRRSKAERTAGESPLPSLPTNRATVFLGMDAWGRRVGASLVAPIVKMSY